MGVLLDDDDDDGDGARAAVMWCRICNLEIAGSNLRRAYFAPRSAQPSSSNPLGSVNEYQL